MAGMLSMYSTTALSQAAPDALAQAKAEVAAAQAALKAAQDKLKALEAQGAPAAAPAAASAPAAAPAADSAGGALLTQMPAIADGAQVIYVSKETGNNRGAGDISKPMKNLQKAIDKAGDNAVILVAQGNYFGTLDAGNIIINKPLKIYGGFSPDFKTRDILKYRTLVQPTATSNGTAKGQGTMQITVGNPHNQRSDVGEVVIDGLLFNRGNSISYNARGEGRPEGVESPMMQPIGGAGIGGPDLTETNVLTTETAELYLDNPSANITIRNCAFVNGPNYGVRGMFKGKADIQNNIFVALRMAAVEIPGSHATTNSVVNFKNNTVLFIWSRLKDLGDMGYGYRYMTKTDSYLDRNIIGLTTFSGIDRTRVDSPASKEAQRKTTCTNSIFFLNRQADLTIPGGGMYQRIKVEGFEDVEQLAEVEGNVALKDPSVFKGKIDPAYLNGFLNVSYKEKTSYDPNSPQNTFRAAMGMNMVGQMQSSATMFMNRYNFDKALELFGAVEGYGAQK
jgi:hypothetical protein